MEKGYTDTTFRKFGEKGNYQKTENGWVKQVEEKKEETPATPVQKEYTDEELAGYARKASDESLRKAGAGANERMRIAAKKELLRRQSEGQAEPEPSENPFDDGLKKGLFDEFPIRTFGDTDYINKGQGWEILEKGKRANIGEIRDWKGVKYQKTVGGWKPVKQGNGGVKKEDKQSVTDDVHKVIMDTYKEMKTDRLEEIKEQHQDSISSWEDLLYYIKRLNRTDKDTQQAISILEHDLANFKEELAEIDRILEERKSLKKDEKYYAKNRAIYDAAHKRAMAKIQDADTSDEWLNSSKKGLENSIRLTEQNLKNAKSSKTSNELEKKEFESFLKQAKEELDAINDVLEKRKKESSKKETSVNKAELELDSSAIGSLKNIINNWYHYAELHSSGQNKQKYSAKSVTNFRNAIKDIAEDDGYWAATDKTQQFVRDFYNEIKTVKADDFEGTMKKLKEFAPKVSDFHNSIKDKLKDA